MTADSLREELLRVIPDLPRYVEARAYLLSGEGSLFGDGAGAVIASPDRTSFSVLGTPYSSALDEALRDRGRDAEVFGGGDSRESLEQYFADAGELATLHWLHGSRFRPMQLREPAKVEVLADSRRIGHVTGDLRDELEDALANGPVAATCVDGMPVSFCYGTESETWWDVAIDTLEPFRRRGLAAAAFERMMELMTDRGKQPVWGALESNIASMKLAKRLGFVPCDRLWLWELD